MKACATNGCKDYAIAFHEFCHVHIHRAYPCAMEGCGNMISDYNKSGYCYDHRWVAQKMRRFKREQEAAILKLEKASRDVGDREKLRAKKARATERKKEKMVASANAPVPAASVPAPTPSAPSDETEEIDWSRYSCHE